MYVYIVTAFKGNLARRTCVALRIPQLAGKGALPSLCVMVYVVMAFVVIAYVVMVYIVMTYVGMASKLEKVPCQAFV